MTGTEELLGIWQKGWTLDRGTMMRNVMFSDESSLQKSLLYARIIPEGPPKEDMMKNIPPYKLWNTLQAGWFGIEFQSLGQLVYIFWTVEQPWMVKNMLQNKLEIHIYCCSTFMHDGAPWHKE